MIVYWSACALSLIIYYFLHNRITVNSKPISNFWKAFFTALPLSMVAGCRYMVGTDFPSYIQEFNLIKAGYTSRMEPLFYLLNKGIAELGLDVQWLFIITSFIFCTLVVLCIIENSKNPYLSIFLFLSTGTYFMFMNGTRQLLACGICLYGFKYIKEKKFVSYLIVVAIASLIHYSCILTIVLYFLSDIKLTRKKCIILLASLFFMSQTIVSIFVSILSKMDYYSYYLTLANSELKMWLYINLASFAMMFLLWDYKNEDTAPFFYSQLVIAGFSIFNGKIPLLSRFMWPFALGQIVGLVNVVEDVHNENNKRIFKFLIVVLYFIYITYSIMISGTNDCNNYQTFFFK